MVLCVYVIVQVAMWDEKEIGEGKMRKERIKGKDGVENEFITLQCGKERDGSGVGSEVNEFERCV